MAPSGSTQWGRWISGIFGTLVTSSIIWGGYSITSSAAAMQSFELRIQSLQQDVNTKMENVEGRLSRMPQEGFQLYADQRLNAIEKKLESIDAKLDALRERR